jgi:hypothetical protein
MAQSLHISDHNPIIGVGSLRNTKKTSVSIASFRNTQRPTSWVPGQGVKQSDHEIDYLSVSGSQV